jgi:hypothetical protein
MRFKIAGCNSTPLSYGTGKDVRHLLLLNVLLAVDYDYSHLINSTRPDAGNSSGLE